MSMEEAKGGGVPGGRIVVVWGGVGRGLEEEGSTYLGQEPTT